MGGWGCIKEVDEVSCNDSIFSLSQANILNITLCFPFTDVQMTQVNVYLDGYEFNHYILYINSLNRLFLRNFKADIYYHTDCLFCIA